MDPRLLEHAFEPFRRGDASGNAWGGVGLGLYIVNQIVLAHGGSVVVRSAEGSGTTFTVTFPTDATRAEAANRL
jgi:signal transduction histidine kinase